jgi:glycosyltransferase involved in cell wall biosynthesis
MGVPDSEAALISPRRRRVEVGGGTAVFVDGTYRSTAGPPSSLRLCAGEQRFALRGWGAAPPQSERGDDYWWTILPVGSVDEPAEMSLTLEASHRGRGDAVTPLGTLELVPEAETAGGLDERIADALAEVAGEMPLVAICMATFDPDPTLLTRQVASIRSQTHERWICLISDDGSGGRGLRAIEEAIGSDRRFVVSRASENAGFYRNFQRALTLVPAEADHVALCDQDDAWHPRKLETLVGAMAGGARLAYSDMRIVAADGSVISDTYWSLRRNNHTDFGSLLVANTVTGAASLFDRGLLDDVLPFPPRHAAAFHDHWIAQVAMALGSIAYVDEPLYDYVQHGDASLGFLSANGNGRYGAPLLRRSWITWSRFRGRRYHLGWRQPYFNVYCRVALAAKVLKMRLGERMDPAKAELVDSLQEPGPASRWLARRVAAQGLSTNETLGRERLMLGGLAWEALQRRRARRAAAPRRY